MTAPILRVVEVYDRADVLAVTLDSDNRLTIPARAVVMVHERVFSTGDPHVEVTLVTGEKVRLGAADDDVEDPAKVFSNLCDFACGLVEG